MKKTLLFLAIVFAFTKLSGQDYHVINFIGINATPETVLVINLTQDAELTIQGTDALRLIIKGVSVEEPTGVSSNQLSIYPNPSEHSCNIQFVNSQPGRVSINLYDITGKLIHDFSGELSVGQHTFQLSGIPAGSYLVKVQTSTSLLSVKFFVTGQSKSAFSLQHTNQVPLKSSLEVGLGQKPNLDPFARSGRSYVEMDFWPGDQMLFVGKASGYDNVGIYNNPDGDQTYTFEFTNWWPAGYEHCFVAPTAVVELTNPATGKTWMDRNLGASQVATASNDPASYGDLYQWGRLADGHQCRYSETTSTLSSSDQPGHGSFTIGMGNPWDWRSPQNHNLWQGLNGINNPCPDGYRIPSEAELDLERESWGSNDDAGAFASTLKLPVSGNRFESNGSLFDVGSYGFYWSSTLSDYSSRYLGFGHVIAEMHRNSRARGFSVRCIKAAPDPPTVTTSVVTGVTANTATSGGEVIDDGGAPVTSRGVVWSQTENPTVDDNEGITTDGEGLGSFSSNLTGLTSETTYFVRAYATNIAGTAYGNEVSFETEPSGANWPAGYVHCGGIETAVAEVTNPTTGKTWMDRNLGASQVATSSTDEAAYGDLYQWGRGADGHQCRNSETTATLSTTDQPGHGNFIEGPSYPFDWRSPQNNFLWQGIDGINNPCPEGFRLPTVSELDAERESWSENNGVGAFASPLKLPVAGARGSGGSLIGVDSYSYCWTSTIHSNQARALFFQTSASNANMNYVNRSGGYSVRCVKGE